MTKLQNLNWRQHSHLWCQDHRGPLLPPPAPLMGDGGPPSEEALSRCLYPRPCSFARCSQVKMETEAVPRVVSSSLSHIVFVMQEKICTRVNHPSSPSSSSCNQPAPGIINISLPEAERKVLQGILRTPAKLRLCHCVYTFTLRFHRNRFYLNRPTCHRRVRRHVCQSGGCERQTQSLLLFFCLTFMTQFDRF